MDITEIINDQYWLAYAKRSADNSASQLNDAAAKVSTMASTFWTMYTATFVIGAALKKIDEPGYVLFLLVLPIPLLILSYVLALWAQMPGLSLTGIDPRVPAQVMKQYNDTTLHKKVRLIMALVALLASTTSLGFALVKANFTHDKPARGMVDVLRSGDHLTLTGDLVNHTIIHYEVHSGTFNKSDSTVVLQDGHFDRSLAAPKDSAVTVSLQWRDPAHQDVAYTFKKDFPNTKKK